MIPRVLELTAQHPSKSGRGWRTTDPSLWTAALTPLDGYSASSKKFLGSFCQIEVSAERLSSIAPCDPRDVQPLDGPLCCDGSSRFPSVFRKSFKYLRVGAFLGIAAPVFCSRRMFRHRVHFWRTRTSWRDVHWCCLADGPSVGPRSARVLIRFDDGLPQSSARFFLDAVFRCFHG